jgi:DNA ligase (NAD+)
MFTLEIIKSNPEKYTKTNKVSEIIKFLEDASNAYYNTDVSIISDVTYDIIYEILKKRDPNNKFFTNIGADISVVDGKVKLTKFLGSQNKIKTQKELNSWINKNTCDKYILGPKIDGSSALYDVVNGVQKLYSRGNGTFGRDISHLIQYLNLPNSLTDISVRGELIVSKNNFKQYDSIFTSPRSMVNSLTSNKTINTEHMKCLDFVVFELYEDLTLEDKLNKTDCLGFITIIYKIVDYSDILLWDNDKSNYLIKKLTTYRENYIYDIDGLIITTNSINTINTTGNPSYSVAFKANNYGVITTIKNIEWNASKHGLLIPRIQFDKINIGSNIEYCTGYSAKYIFNNCLNRGSKIRVILSGEIIPTIAEVVKQAHCPGMPDVNYKWDTNRVHIHTPEETDEQSVKKIVSFLKTINIENMGIGIVKKLYNSGYNSIKKILEVTVEQLKVIDGFEDTLSIKIVNNITNALNEHIYLPFIMHGSCEFKYGFGIKKFEKIIEKYPNFLNEELSVEMLNNVPSFNGLSSEKFIENLPQFKLFLTAHPQLKYKFNNSTNVDINSNINGKNIVFTGKRDKDLIDKIIKYNGIIQLALTKKTDYLVVDDINKISSKIQKAKELNIEIVTKEEILTKFYSD